MMETLLSLTIVTPLTIVLSAIISNKLVPKWDSRENYGYQAGQWKKLLALSVMVAFVFTALLGILDGVSLFASVALGLLAFFLTATALTDAKSHLVPKELTNMALIVGLATGTVGFLTAQYYESDYLTGQMAQLTFQLTHFILYMVAIGLMFVVIMFTPVVGFADIKMFWATGLFIGSFFFVQQLLAVFMLMVVLMAFQLVWSMIKAKSWKVSDGLPALPAFAVAFMLITLTANWLL